MPVPRSAVPLTSAVTVAAAVATAATYAVALHSLGTAGPNPVGYDLLLAANRAVVVDAGLLVATGVLLATTRGARWTRWLLGAAAVTTFTAAAGLQMLGASLAAFRPTQRPLDLGSLLLAMQGSGADLMPAAALLALGVLLVSFMLRLRTRREERLLPLAAPASAG